MFSAGYDIGEIPEEEFEERAEQLVAHPFTEAIDALEAFPYPTLAVLPGHTIGGGLELALACDLRVAKDTIKDALMAELGVPDIEASRRLGRAAVQTMLAIAAASPVGAVLESNFYRSFAGPELERLPGMVIEVFCRCDRGVAVARYHARAGSRHPGHFDAVRAPDELWNDDISEPVAGGWPRCR